MQKYVVDPQDNGDCYGKYEKSEKPPYIPDNELVEVRSFDGYSVVEWRYD